MNTMESMNAEIESYNSLVFILLSMRMRKAFPRQTKVY